MPAKPKLSQDRFFVTLADIHDLILELPRLLVAGVRRINHSYSVNCGIADRTDLQMRLLVGLIGE